MRQPTNLIQKFNSRHRPTVCTVFSHNITILVIEAVSLCRFSKILCHWASPQSSLCFAIRNCHILQFEKDERYEHRFGDSEWLMMKRPKNHWIPFIQSISSVRKWTAAALAFASLSLSLAPCQFCGLRGDVESDSEARECFISPKAAVLRHVPSLYIKINLWFIILINHTDSADKMSLFSRPFRVGLTLLLLCWSVGYILYVFTCSAFINMDRGERVCG